MLQPALGVGTLLLTDHRDRLAAEAREAADDGVVLAEIAVARQRREVGEQVLDVVEAMRPVWVAGKQLSVGPEAHSFAIAIAGNYTVECNGAVRLDNVARACGSVIALSAGPHRASAAVPGRLTLRWGDHLMVPRKPPPQQPIYYGF